MPAREDAVIVPVAPTVPCAVVLAAAPESGARPRRPAPVVDRTRCLLTYEEYAAAVTASSELRWLREGGSSAMTTMGHPEDCGGCSACGSRCDLCGRTTEPDGGGDYHGVCWWCATSTWLLYDSATKEVLTTEDLGVTDGEYRAAVRESVATLDGHVRIAGRRVYAQ